MTCKQNAMRPRVACTIEEIGVEMARLQKQYDSELKNPDIFWPAMGIDHAKPKR